MARWMKECIDSLTKGYVTHCISLVIAKRYPKLNTITVYVWFEHKYNLSLGLLDLYNLLTSVISLFNMTIGIILTYQVTYTYHM